MTFRLPSNLFTKSSAVTLLVGALVSIGPTTARAQADNEIQVYASPTIGKDRMIVELHSNHTLRGLPTGDPDAARWTNETIEITYGLADDLEIGFYTFTGVSPDGQYQYQGNQLRPRITAPTDWAWPVGVSLSAEFGFFRPDRQSDFVWQGELRPIVDWSHRNTYVAFNPNIDLVVTGTERGVGFAPQAKLMQGVANLVGIGVEYYGAMGNVMRLRSLGAVEHLLGPAVDFLGHPDWELNLGFLFGLTDASNQHILKLLLGKRFAL